MNYEELERRYQGFAHPRAKVLLGGKELDSSAEFFLNEISIELTAGYEASVASFRIYNVYHTEKNQFRYAQMEKQVVLGNSVVLSLGYLDQMQDVFVGFISQVSFGYESGALPYVEVTAMDVKGILMSGCYAQQLKATVYSDAVREVLDRTGQGKWKKLGILSKEYAITPTPDAGRVQSRTSSPITVEMVGESDYEFLVRAAKRYHYEFFVHRGQVIFRPAKQDPSILMELSPQKGLQEFQITYNITGLVGAVEARAMNPSSGKVIASKTTVHNQISTGNRANQIVDRGKQVYLDASITSKEEADARVNALVEQMSYRFGSLDGTCVGIPDLVPGRFVQISGMGRPADNRFYLTTVHHQYTSEGGYATHIQGCAAQMQG